VVADMPFLSYGVDRSDAVEHCGRMLPAQGAYAVKIERNEHTVELTERLTDLGVPVMAHVGLTPQSVNQTGYLRQGTDSEEAREIADLARRHEDAGAFACVLEHVPENLAATITDELDVPTVGIGAGRDCDGQVLVINDVLGLSERSPPFAEAFGNVREEMESALDDYVAAVESGAFPGDEHSHTEPDLDELY